jgi:hypothetical protein
VPLSQKELIGYWVPTSEPGSSNVTHIEQKWFGGLDWSQIDADYILRLPTGKEDIEIDLKEHQPVMEELERLPEIRYRTNHHIRAHWHPVSGKRISLSPAQGCGRGRDSEECLQHILSKARAGCRAVD